MPVVQAPAVLCEGSASQPAVPVETDARLRFTIHSENTGNPRQSRG